LHFGYAAAQEWIIGCLEKNVDFAELTARRDTPRAVLNRYCQASYGFHPELQTLKDGVVRLMNPITGQVIATGHGDSQKAAVLDAVSKALEYYNISLYVT
jgi:dsRNA-specific ribonuclease